MKFSEVAPVHEVQSITANVATFTVTNRAHRCDTIMWASVDPKVIFANVWPVAVRPRAFWRLSIGRSLLTAATGRVVSETRE